MPLTCSVPLYIKPMNEPIFLFDCNYITRVEHFVWAIFKLCDKIPCVKNQNHTLSPMTLSKISVQFKIHNFKDHFQSEITFSVWLILIAFLVLSGPIIWWISLINFRLPNRGTNTNPLMTLNKSYSTALKIFFSQGI
jgi:hypothetical protein